MIRAWLICRALGVDELTEALAVKKFIVPALAKLARVMCEDIQEAGGQMGNAEDRDLVEELQKVPFVPVDSTDTGHSCWCWCWCWCGSGSSGGGGGNDAVEDGEKAQAQACAQAQANVLAAMQPIRSVSPEAQRQTHQQAARQMQAPSCSQGGPGVLLEEQRPPEDAGGEQQAAYFAPRGCAVTMCT